MFEQDLKYRSAALAKKFHLQHPDTSFFLKLESKSTTCIISKSFLKTFCEKQLFCPFFCRLVRHLCLKFVTKVIKLIVTNLVAPQAAAKREVLLNKVKVVC